MRTVDGVLNVNPNLFQSPNRRPVLIRFREGDAGEISSQAPLL